ncbi:unannotated protein [freshwater metagenome]|uniref:Unannotated protein n=1 Tax=freshwater metagenome TaxID=449393 RepID=A0A6J6E2P9_9ZZZZ
MISTQSQPKVADGDIDARLALTHSHSYLSLLAMIERIAEEITKDTRDPSTVPVEGRLTSNDELRGLHIERVDGLADQLAYLDLLIIERRNCGIEATHFDEISQELVEADDLSHQDLCATSDRGIVGVLLTQDQLTRHPDCGQWIT